jgi:hypothetical protein
MRQGIDDDRAATLLLNDILDLIGDNQVDVSLTALIAAIASIIATTAPTLQSAHDGANLMRQQLGNYLDAAYKKGGDNANTTH